MRLNLTALGGEEESMPSFSVTTIFGYFKNCVRANVVPSLFFLGGSGFKSRLSDQSNQLVTKLIFNEALKSTFRDNNRVGA